MSAQTTESIPNPALCGPLTRSELDARGAAAPVQAKWAFSRLASALVSALFVALIWVPLLASMKGYDPLAPELEEFRPSSPWPKLDRSKPGFLREYVSGLEAYWNDRFGFRRSLIWLHSYVQVAWLRVSSSTQVILGKHGWLFYTGEDLGEVYRVTDPLWESELRYYGNYLEQRRRWLQAHHCRFLVVFVPEKQTIYPEELPPEILRLRDVSRLDQLEGELAVHSSVDVIDLRPALLAAKQQQIIYLKLDTHWNDRGAYEGYRAIADWMAARYPSVRTHPLEDFEAIVDDGSAKVGRRIPKGILFGFRHPDLPRLLGLEMGEFPVVLLPKFRPEAVPAPAPQSRPFLPLPSRMAPFALSRADPTLPRGIVYHDSFAKSFIPTLAEHFQRLACLQAGYFNFDPDLVEREKPDVLIYEICERYVGSPAFR